MGYAIVSSLKVCCSHCGALFPVNAKEYIGNHEEVEPSFIVGVEYQTDCTECGLNNNFALPSSMLIKFGMPN